MSSQEPVNRYNGPRTEPEASSRRLPEMAPKVTLGWRDHLDSARGFASMARKKADPKEKIAFAISAVGHYEEAIFKMSGYNAGRNDPHVAKEIAQAKSEMDAVMSQFKLMSD